MGEMSSGAQAYLCVRMCECVNLTSRHCRSRLDTIHQSHTDPRPQGKHLLLRLVGKTEREETCFAELEILSLSCLK